MENENTDNIKTGFISIYRSIKKHWIWSDPVKFQWWIDILLDVNHTKQKVNIGNQLFECERGQSVKTLLSWGKSWNVSKDKARNFLRLLENDNMITLENLTKTTRLTVCNYDSYQAVLHDNTTQAKRKPNASQTQSHTNNNDNKEIIKKDIEYFEDKDINKLFLEYLQLRKKEKLSNSQLVTDRLIKKLREYSDNKKQPAIEIIMKAITSKWKDFYPLKEN